MVRRKRYGYIPRVIIGKRKGIKTKVRIPSQMSGYIYHTFASRAEAKRYLKNVSRWARSRAKITKA